MKLHCWQGCEPEGTEPAMYWCPCVSTLATMKHWVGRNWKQGPGHCIILAVGHTNLPTIFGFGQVCDAEACAEHISSGMGGWEAAKAEWVRLLEWLYDRGYGVDAIAGDMEGCYATRNTRVNGIFLRDVAVAMYQYGYAGLPHIDVERFKIDNVYGVKENEREMAVWDDWATKQTIDRWESVFAEPAEEVFGDECLIFNYDCNEYFESPMRNPAGLPRVNCKFGDASSPVLYEHERRYKTAKDAIADFDRTIAGMACPWIQHERLEGKDGFTGNARSRAWLQDALAERGVPLTMVFG